MPRNIGVDHWISDEDVGLERPEGVAKDRHQARVYHVA